MLAGAAGLAAGLAGCLGGGSTAEEPADTPDLGAPYLGADSRESADAVVLAFADFRCSHCKTFKQEVLPPLREELLGDGRVRFEHHDFPVVDAWSWRVAMAARSAQEQAGNDAFWAFADGAYRRQTETDSYELLRSVADGTAADADTVVEDVRGERHRAVVEADQTTGSEMGVGGTPTVFVNGQQVAAGYDPIASAVRSAL